MEGFGPRDVGRPSRVVQYAPQVAQWLREDPDLSGAEILRRVRLAGYRGGKSALYELVRTLRPPVPAERLIIVASNRRNLYEHLKRAFAANKPVRVLLNRRVVERRAHSGPYEAERRRGDRRSPVEISIDGRILKIRKASTPDDVRREIYRVLQIPHEVNKPVKTWTTSR